MIRSSWPSSRRRLIAVVVLGALVAAGCGQSGGSQVTAAPPAATQAPANATAVPTAAPTIAPAATPSTTPAATPYYRY